MLTNLLLASANEYDTIVMMNAFEDLNILIYLIIISCTGYHMMGISNRDL